MKEHPSLNDCISLLSRLISTPSFSNEEDATADIWEKWLIDNGVEEVGRFHNNVFALSDFFDLNKPTLLLNSHHDTVRPSKSYLRDPFKAEIEGDKL